MRKKIQNIPRPGKQQVVSQNTFFEKLILRAANFLSLGQYKLTKYVLPKTWLISFEKLGPILRFIVNTMGNCKRLPSHTGQEQACSRITRLFVTMPKWPNTQENGCCLPPSDHIQSKILFQAKEDQERGMNGPASLLHS